MTNENTPVAEPLSIEELRFRSSLSTTYFSRIFSALTAITYREKGEDAVNKLWYRVLSSHQNDRYEEGLKKLGIENDPPAVAAAKYHYFTNLIAGLDMEYVEETDKKVWVRYRAPMWMYPGVALIAMPASVRRTVFSAWHPMNGRYMGCNSLGYVGTKFSMEGDPYDEGYFIEHEVDLSDEEILKYEVVTHSPEFKPSAAPRLDADLWPEARVLKARPKFSSGYVQATVDAMYWEYGEFATHQMIASAMRMLAVQITPDLVERVGISDASVASIAEFHRTLLTALRRDVMLEQDGESSYRLTIKSNEPFDSTYPEGLKHAFFEFHSMATRKLNGHVLIEHLPQTDGSEVWQLKDTGRWLW